MYSKNGSLLPSSKPTTTNLTPLPNQLDPRVEDSVRVVELVMVVAGKVSQECSPLNVI